MDVDFHITNGIPAEAETNCHWSETGSCNLK